MFFNKKKRRKGFTLAETLTVVAIIAILLAVAVPNVLAYYRQLKITGLDDDAKTIFMAAQSRLTAMMAAGEDMEPTPGATGTGTGTCVYTGGSSDVKFSYITNGYDKVSHFLPGGSIESQLQQNNYIIEYSTKTGAVNAVWYWESETDFDYSRTVLGSTSEYTANNYTTSERLKNNQIVGYYGGDGIDRLSVGQMPIPQLTLTNAEELRLDIVIPTDDFDTSSFDSDDILVDVYLNGGSDDVQILINSTLKYDVDNKQVLGTVVLDTLDASKYSSAPAEIDGKKILAGKAFKDWTTTNGAPLGIDPGSNIDVTVVVHCDKEMKLTGETETFRFLSQSATVHTNSLFADVDETTHTAKIAYGRHLQNLDTDISGVNKTGSTFVITKAEQTRDINFYQKDASDAIHHWASTYPGADTYSGGVTFKPITNDALTSYNGGDHQIRNLDIDVTSGNAGLFAKTVTDFTFDGLTLVNPRVVGTGTNFGALVGSAGGVTVNNCGIYNEFKDANTDPSGVQTLLDPGFILTAMTQLTDSTYKPYIGSMDSDTTAGGLIGSASGTVNITGSFASAVTVGSANAGGLVGNAGGDVEIGTSYAAGFVFGTGNCAGLVGNVADSASTVKIENSYAAGEIMNAGTGFAGAGLFNRGSGATGANTVFNCYAAVEYANASGVTGSISVYGTFDGDTANYYVQQGGVSYSGGKVGTESSLATDFATGTDDWIGSGVSRSGFTHPYSLLDDLSGTDYPYPMLAVKDVQVSDGAGSTSIVDLPKAHYGDWVKGVNGEATAAYIEEYSSNRYGVYAAKLNAISAGVKSVNIIYNSLQNEVVVDDFYRFISPSMLATGTKFTLDGDTTERELVLDTSFGAGGKIEDKDKNEFYVYKLDNAPNWDSAKNYYHKIELNIGGSAKTYLYNPSFACEAFDVTEYLSAAPGNTVNDTEKLPKPGMDKFVPNPDKGTKHNDTDVYIRSARQLANIQKYTTDTNAPKDGSGAVCGLSWKYEQLANINFNAYTKTGFTTGKSDTARLEPAMLTSGEYYGHQYTISNLYIGKGTETYAGLFERVGGTGVTGGKLDGMRLVNVDVDGGDATATGGLVGMLYGQVEDCGIYVKAGAGENITDVYKSWTVTGTGANGVGGLIGEINVNGSATLSFASVKVDGTGAGGSGNGPVGGFAGQIAAGGTVEDCYAGGFIDASTKTYSATNANVTGGGNVGGFVGTAASGSRFTGVNYSTASVKGPKNVDTVGLFAGDMTGTGTNTGPVLIYAISSAFDDDDAPKTPRDESAYMGGTATGVTRETPVTYNQTDSVFPYESGQTVHHGDWIEVEAMGIYYDTVGTTTGYYANGGNISGTVNGNPIATLATGTPGDGQVATDDGYMFVTRDDLGAMLSIKVGGKDFTMERKELSPAWTIDTVTYSYKYEVPAEALNTPTDNYYTAVSINGRIFYANFGAACEIFDTVNNVNTPMAKNDIAGLGTTTTSTGVVVRSARQLANIGIRSNMGTYNSSKEKNYTKAAEAIQTAAISQVLDIDYSKYTATYEKAGTPGTPGTPGTSVTKIPDAAVLTGSNANANHTPITINGGSYDGHEYEIRNLVPGMVRFYDDDADQAYVESGLVGRIAKGEIKNVTLINATVSNDAGKVTGAVANEVPGVHVLDVGVAINKGELKTEKYHANTSVPVSDGYFTLVNKSSEAGIAQSASAQWEHDSATVYSGKYCINFGGKSSDRNSHISFTTSGAATVKVWWVQYENSSHEKGGLKLYKNNVGNGSTNSGWTASSGDVGTAYFTVFNISDAGKYYLGDHATNGNKIFRVEVYEPAATSVDTSDPTPCSISTPPYEVDPTDPGYDGFPTGLTTADYQVRFGALLGASIADTTNTTDTNVKIENCGVYVVPVDERTGEELPNPDTEAYTTNYEKFVVNNSGASAADAVGGLIGMAGDGTGISTCFAAVKVTGNEKVGGFIGHLKNSTIQNCYSGGHTIKGMYSTTDYNVTAKDTDEGYAGGFAGQIENSDVADNLKFVGVNYSTSSAKGGAKAGNFAGNIVDAGKKWSGFNGAGNTVYGVGATFAPKYTDERAYLDSTMTLHAYGYGSSNEAKPYDMDVLGSSYYPYEVPADTVHHGDWPMRYNIIYYELYKDPIGDYKDSFSNTLKNRDVKLDHANDATEMGAEYIGFYGKIPRTGGTSSTAYDIINTLRVSGTVYDSGYMIVSDANVDSMLLAINSHYVDREDEDTAEKELGNRNYYDENPDVPRPLHTTTLRTAVKLDFTEATGYKIKNENDTNETAAGKLLGGNYGYVIPAEGLLLPAASDDFYMETQINGQTYLFNPQFPCEAVNVDIDKTLSDGTREINYSDIRDKEGINYVWIDENGDSHLEKDKEIKNTLIIRSPLNLAGFVRYSRQSSTGLVKDKIIKYKFEQHMDVDYAEYAPKVYDGYSGNRKQVTHDEDPSLKDNDKDELNNKVYKDYVTGKQDHGQVPGLLDGGQYNGRNHKISNLWLACDSDDSTKIGLFGELRNGAVVENVQMENIHLQSNRDLASADKDYKTSVGALAAMVHNATIKNVTIKNVSIDAGDDVSSSDKRPKFEAIGGAIGKIGKIETARTTLGEPENVEVSNVTVIDPTIEVSIKYNTSKDVKVGGVIGSADGKTFVYSSTADADTRSVNITGSGVYLSEANKGNFNTMGVNVSGDELSDDVAGGFAGYLGKGVNVTKDYAAIRVRGKTYAGGFAGHIEGSHVENCYSGGHTVSGSYSASAYNVEASGSDGKAGGFAGRIQVAYESGSSGPIAMYMTGVNYTTSSVKGDTVGKFAGEAAETAAAALMEKMGAKAPVNYAGGTTEGTLNKESTVKTGSGMPRQDKTGMNFTTLAYDSTLTGNFPYKTNLKVHHGDWVDSQLNAVGYWEVEDDKVRVWYIPADAPDTPVTMHETDTLDFDHNGRDGMGITDSGYFVVSSDTSATFSGVPTTKMDLDSGYGKTIKALLGGDLVNVEVYKLNDGKVDNQTWTVNGNNFTVNPAYAKAIEFKGAGAGATELGTDKKPYEIRTVKQLENIGEGNTSNFEQTHDIVFKAGDNYTSIKDFKGHFDGGFYRIIDNTKPVFDTVTGSSATVPTIENVIVYAPVGYTSKTISGNGGLANSTSGDTLISNTIVAGFTISGSGNVGGLVGEVTGGSLTISQSEATNKLSGTNVGGLVGNVSGGSLSVEQSYAGGSITSATNAGGLVGAGSGTITYTDVYSYVDMTGVSSPVYGIGPGNVSNTSVLQEYWSTGLNGKTAADTGNNITGVSLAQIKFDTQEKFSDATASEYCKPDNNDGLKNRVPGEEFPFAAFVKDTEGNHYHYGEFPETEYVGAFYHEVENGEDHFYAYGGEIYNNTVYQMKLLDTLCYDHHLNGERESISNSGYGVFYPSGWSVTSPGLGTDINGDIRDKLVEYFGLDTSTEVKSFTGTGEVKVTLDDKGSGMNVTAQTYPAFAAAIGNEIGKNVGDMGGSESYPIQIRTYGQLQSLTKESVGSNYNYFAITHDIDAAASRTTDKYTPGKLGVNLNGNGYRIIDLNIEAENAGLFTEFSSAGTIQGVILYAPNNDGVITATGTGDNGNAGGILAKMGFNGSSIENCVVSGYTIKGTGYVGGIIGEVTSNNPSITNCQAVNTLDGSGTATGIGGIAGRANGGSITDCYAGGVIKNATTSTPVGGIYGDVSGTPKVEKCYSYMNLTDSTNNGTKYAIGETSSGIDNNTCYYLSEYATGATSQGTAKSFDEMMAEKTGSAAKYVYVPGADTTGVKGLVNWGDSYPFAATVKVGVRAGVDTGVSETDEVFVHYGVWPDVAGIAYWMKDIDNNYIVQIVGVDLLGNKLKDELTERETNKMVAASGYAVIMGSGNLKLDAEPTPKTNSESTEKSGVITAINAALKDAGVNGFCTRTKTKVYDNENLFGELDKTAHAVRVDSADSTKTITVGDGVTLYYNPGMSGVGYEEFKSTGVNIHTAAELDGIPDFDSSVDTTNTTGYIFKQTCDINAKDYHDYTGAVDFAGDYDGQGFRILDLNMEGTISEKDSGIGLFNSTKPAIGTKQTIKNVILYSTDGDGKIEVTVDDTTESTKEKIGVGGIVGFIGGNTSGGGTVSQIQNCAVAGYTINVTKANGSKDSFNVGAGGIAGYAYYNFSIQNCEAVNHIELECENGYVGGILGALHSGSLNTTEIKGSYAGGSIETTKDTVYSGGIFGYDAKDGTVSLDVDKCYTYVDLSKVKVSTSGTAKCYTIGYKNHMLSGKTNYYLDVADRYPSSLSANNKNGMGKTYAKLQTLNIDGFNAATESYVPSNAKGGDVTGNGTTAQGTNFPFPAVVQKVNGYKTDGTPIYGDYVHYGEWPASTSGSGSPGIPGPSFEPAILPEKFRLVEE